MEKQKYDFADELKTLIDTTIADDRDDSTVTVLPVRCGIGKSTYVRNKIREICQSDSPDGLIIITDSVERLRSYDKPDSDNPYDSLLLEFPHKISIITAENASEAMKYQAHCKVLLMTTQRYFRFTREEIINLLRYKDGKRTTIIFDERPFLKETKSLTIKDFNDVDSALKLGLDDTVDQVEKEWCISQWGRLRDIITSKMDSYERNIKKKKFYLWHTNDQQGMTVDDKRFMRFIDNCKAKISTQKFVDAYRTILAIQQLSEDGALFSCCKSQSGEYDKRFSLAIDNRDKLTNLGSKVIILDGTGDIAPEYKADYIKKVDCSQFNVPLRNLYIRCVDVKTGKTRLSSGDRKAQVAIEAIRKDIVQKTPDAPIFTFQQIESEFEDKETDDPEKKNDSKVKKTSHFGNIKGINSYRTCTSIVQVGLNRYQEIEYFLISNFPDDKMKYLKTLPPEKSVEEFDKIFHVRKKGIVSIHDTMIAAILTDTEQNLFRGAIRNVNFDGNFMFTMYFDTMMYKDLITCMKARYSGANFIEEPTLPDIDKDNAQNRKTEKPSASQIGFDWFDKQPRGRIFKRQDVKDETGLDDDDFKDWKRRHKNFFKEMSTEKQGIYRKP